jgi:hypothetical protein
VKFGNIYINHIVIITVIVTIIKSQIQKSNQFQISNFKF